MAAAIEIEIRLMSPMVVPMAWIAWTASRVAPWIAAICAAISSVALPVWVASAFTSEATTAKPRPASPACAASIVALRARRLVWPAIAWMSCTTSTIFEAASASPRTIASVRSASTTARPAMFEDCVIWCDISATVTEISSAAAATLRTLSVASPEAEATAVAWWARLIGGRRHGGRNRAHLARGRAQPLEEHADLVVEATDVALDDVVARVALLLRFALLGLELARRDGVLLEHLDGIR